MTEIDFLIQYFKCSEVSNISFSANVSEQGRESDRYRERKEREGESKINKIKKVRERERGKSKRLYT